MDTGENGIPSGKIRQIQNSELYLVIKFQGPRILQKKPHPGDNTSILWGVASSVPRGEKSAFRRGAINYLGDLIAHPHTRRLSINEGV